MPSVGVMSSVVKSEFVTTNGGSNLDYIELAPSPNEEDDEYKQSRNDGYADSAANNSSLLNGILFIDDEVDDVNGYGENIGINLKKPSDEHQNGDGGKLNGHSTKKVASTNSNIEDYSEFISTTPQATPSSGSIKKPVKTPVNEIKSNNTLSMKNRSSFYDNHYWYDDEPCASSSYANGGQQNGSERKENGKELNGNNSNENKPLDNEESNQKAKTFISEKSILIEQVVSSSAPHKPDSALSEAKNGEKSFHASDNSQSQTNGEVNAASSKPDRDDFDDLIDLTQRVPKRLLKADYIAFSNAPKCKAYGNGNSHPVTASEKNLTNIKNDFKGNGLRNKFSSSSDKNASLPPLPPLSSHSFRHERATPKMEAGTAGSTSSLSAVQSHSTTRLIIPLKREGNTALNSASLTCLPGLNSGNSASGTTTPVTHAVNNSLLSTSAHTIQQQQQQQQHHNSNGTNYAPRQRTIGDVLRENNHMEQNHHHHHQPHHRQQPLVRSNGFDGLSSASTVSSSSSSMYYDDKCSPSQTGAAQQHKAEPYQHYQPSHHLSDTSDNRYASQHHQTNGGSQSYFNGKHVNGNANGSNGNSYLSSFVNKYSGPPGVYAAPPKNAKNNVYQLHNDVIYEEENSKPVNGHGHVNLPKLNETPQRPKPASQDVSQEWDQITKIFESLETLLNEVVESTASKPLQPSSNNNSKSGLNTLHVASSIKTSSSEHHSPASSAFLSPGSSISNSSTNPSVSNEPVVTSHLYKSFNPAPEQYDLSHHLKPSNHNQNSRDTYDEPVQLCQNKSLKPGPHTQQSSVKLWVKNSGQHPSTMSNGVSNEHKKLNPKNSKHVEVCEFLKNLNLAKYEFVFITNGYDDINYLNHVITLQDLLHMGIEDYEDTFKILKEIKNLPSSIKRIVDENLQFSSVSEWLDYLNLSEYKDTFTLNHIDSFKRVKQLWEIELTTILQIPYLGHRQRIISSIEAKSRIDGEHSRREDEEAKNLEKNFHFQSTQTDDYLENKSNGSTNSTSSSNATKKSVTSSNGCVKSVKFAEDSCTNGPSNKISSVTHHVVNANSNNSNDTHSNSSCNSNKNQSDFQSSSSLEENSSLELEPNESINIMPISEPKNVEYALKPLFSNDQYKLLATSAMHAQEPKSETLNRKLIGKPQQSQPNGGVSREDLSGKKKFESKPSAFEVDKKMNGKKPVNGQSKVESRPPPMEPNASESQRSPKPVWKNDPQHLIKNTCNFSVQYLGSSALTKLKSNLDPVKYTIDRLKNTAKASPHPSPLVELAVSINGVKLLHSKTKELLWNHDIKHINNVCQDQDDLNYFAFSTQTDPSAHYYCHVFACKEKELTTKIILTIGQAFDLAYELFCKNNL